MHVYICIELSQRTVSLHFRLDFLSNGEEPQSVTAIGHCYNPETELAFTSHYQNQSFFEGSCWKAYIEITGSLHS